MTASGCLSRILGPICVSVLYARYGTFWLSTVTALMMAIPMAWLILVRKRLVITSPDVKNSVELETFDVKEKPIGNTKARL